MPAERLPLEQVIDAAKANTLAVKPVEAIEEARTATTGDETTASEEDDSLKDDDQTESLNTNDDDVFARLRKLAVLKDEATEGQLETPQEQPQQWLPASASQAVENRGTHSHGGELDEESIDDYMTRLLHRLRGAPENESAPPANRPVNAANPPAVAAASTGEPEVSSPWAEPAPRSRFKGL